MGDHGHGQTHRRGRLGHGAGNEGKGGWASWRSHKRGRPPGGAPVCPLRPGSPGARAARDPPRRGAPLTPVCPRMTSRPALTTTPAWRRSWTSASTHPSTWAWRSSASRWARAAPASAALLSCSRPTPAPPPSRAPPRQLASFHGGLSCRRRRSPHRAPAPFAPCAGTARAARRCRPGDAMELPSAHGHGALPARQGLG